MLDIEDASALTAYLRAGGRLERGESPEIRVLRGGVSNRTVWLRRADGEAWVLKQALPKLRVEVDWFSDPRRIEREALAMQWLGRLAPKGTITRLVFLDPDVHLLAMEAVPEPHENLKTVLLAGRVEPGHIEQFAVLLATVHREATQRLDRLPAELADRDFFESLRLEPYYAFSAEQVQSTLGEQGPATLGEQGPTTLGEQGPTAATFLHELIEEARHRKETLVHGDYSPKNVLVHRNLLVLLDHEVAHLGDAAFDLGFSMTHLLSKAHHLPEHRAAFAEAARRYWATYLETLGQVPWRDGLAARAARHTLGCLLARVAGRSPLEYLDDAARERQRHVVVRLMHDPPPAVPELIDAFLAALD